MSFTKRKNCPNPYAALLDVKQSLSPVYHPQDNLVKRKNRDLEPRLFIIVGKE